MSNMFNDGTEKESLNAPLKRCHRSAQLHSVKLSTWHLHVTVAETSHSSFTYPTFSSDAVRPFCSPAKAFNNQLKRQQIDNKSLKSLKWLRRKAGAHVTSGRTLTCVTRHQEQQQLLVCPDEKSSTLPPRHFSGIATCGFDANGEIQKPLPADVRILTTYISPKESVHKA